jgi:hypothetical protein
MNDSNGSGSLRQVLEAAINAASATLADYTVLAPQNDPYRLDLPDNHRNAAWFAQMIERYVSYGRNVHLRGLHYRLVAASDVIRPDNSLPYTNTEEAWVWLTTRASKAGRWLGYVPFERIVDERNAAPELFVFGDSRSWSGHSLLSGSRVQIPTLYEAEPRFYCSGFQAQQPFRIFLIGEKISLRDALLPIAQRVGGELLLPTGEMSDTMVAGIAARASGDGRPSVVLYFSDFDPSGHQMPISVARKLQALRHLQYPDLNIQVHHVALTIEQVRRLDLPSTPLKETERRGDRWRTVMQHEQTEIDALAALRPQELRNIALDAIKPFYDDTLATRSETARHRWEVAAQRHLTEHPDYHAAVANIREARSAVEEVANAFHSVQDSAVHTLEGIELPPIIAPELMIDAAAPSPLFTTDDDYITASLKLKSYKALTGGNEVMPT